MVWMRNTQHESVNIHKVMHLIHAKLYQLQSLNSKTVGCDCKENCLIHRIGKHRYSQDKHDGPDHGHSTCKTSDLTKKK